MAASTMPTLMQLMHSPLKDVICVGDKPSVRIALPKPRMNIFSMGKSGVFRKQQKMSALVVLVVSPPRDQGFVSTLCETSMKRLALRYARLCCWLHTCQAVSKTRCSRFDLTNSATSGCCDRKLPPIGPDWLCVPRSLKRH